MDQDTTCSARRTFLGQLGLMALAASVGPSMAEAEPLISPAVTPPPWDMSWVDRVTAAPYKAVIDETKIENDALYTALDILDTFHDVYPAPNEQARVVVVFRHFAAAMGLNDAMWDRYGIGEERSVTDPDTKAPAKRNIFLRATTAKEKWEVNGKIEPLVERGVIILVCNRATMGLASSLAKKTSKPVEEVQNDLKANLIPGAALMPNGIFGLIRAQNAGCALYKQA